MRNTFQISFYCRESKADRNGLSHIEIGITLNGKRCFLNLPMKVKPDEFNAKKRPQYIEDYVASMRLRINQILTELACNGEPLTLGTIKEYLRTGGIKSYTVDNLITDFMKMVNAKPIADEHKNKYRTICQLVAKHAKSEVSSITAEVIGLCENELRSKYSAATACGYLTKLKALIRYAMDNGKLAINPTQNIKIVKPKPVIEQISDSDLKMLITHDFSYCKRLEKVRDAFVFACGSGLAYVDMAALTATNFKMVDGYLCCVGNRHKTGVPYCSVLLDHAKDVAVKYHYNLSPLQLSNQKMNAYLKEISDLCGTSIPLHYHLGRHRYAQSLLNNGVKVEVLQRAGGWTSSSIIFRHYGHIQDATVVKEITTKAL